MQSNYRRVQMLLAVLVFVGLLFWQNRATAAASAAIAALHKTADGQWFVTYQLPSTAKRLAFSRNPDDSRSRRWLPQSAEFAVTYEQGQEFIQRRDGKSFDQVRLKLTPSYTHLPKDYAPFAPYSDGGVLIHTGRFFACPEHCDDSINQWTLALSTATSDRIILGAKAVKQKAEWVDSDSGRQVYVGPSQPRSYEAFDSLFDPGLPEDLRQALANQLPQLLVENTRQFGAPDQRPMIFASWGKREDGRYGQQGGVLPGQIFMHWYGNQLPQLMQDPEFTDTTLWFFAHEAGHYIQGNTLEKIDNSIAWIHEGHAEFLAYSAIKSKGNSSAMYAEKRLSQARQKCVAGLQDSAMSNASSLGRFDLHYSCGLLIHSAIASRINENTGSHDGAVRIWKSFSSEVAKSSPEPAPIESLFFSSLGNLTTPSYAERVKTFVHTQSQRQEDAKGAIDGLFQ